MVQDSKSFINFFYILAAVCIILVIVVFAVMKPDFAFKNVQAEDIAQTPTTITITSSGPVPKSIRIKKGNLVTWVNDDTYDHQVESDVTNGGSQFSSMPLAKGDTYSFRFATPGTYNYHDTLNVLNFGGTVVVLN